MAEESNPRAATPVTRVICASVSRIDGSVMGELVGIRNRVCVPGTECTLRGAVLYSSGWFLLWLEGEAQAVEAAVQRAAHNRRNAHQKIIHRSRGPATLVDPLTIASTQGADAPSTFAQRIYRVKGEFESGSRRAPAQIWRQLSAPSAIARAAQDFEPDRHVALVAAGDNGPLELLRKLGDRFASPVVYQRFAGSTPRTADIGGAYTDIALEDGIHRIQLLSRGALALPLVRVPLASLDALLVLVGSRAEPAIELALTARELLQALPSRPALVLVSSDDAVAREVGASVRGEAGTGPAVIGFDELPGWLAGSAPIAVQRPPARHGPSGWARTAT